MMSVRATAAGLAAAALVAATSARAAETTTAAKENVPDAGVPAAPPSAESERAEWFRSARAQIYLNPKEGRANLRRALAGPHDTSPAGVTRRLRNAALLAEWWHLEELPTITKAVADIDLAETLPESFDLLAALGRTKSPRVLPLLIRGLAFDLFKNRDERIDLGPAGVVERMAAPEIIFAPFGADVCKLLPPLLGKADDHTAASASMVLGMSRCREARPLLRKWTESPDPMAAGSSLVGLGLIGDAADRSLFRQWTFDAKPGYRKVKGAQALALLAGDTEVTRLIELLADRDSFVRDIALETLFRAPDARALAALIAQRKNEAIAADVDEFLAALALEAGVPAQTLNANVPKATLDDVAARIARNRDAERKKGAQALPGSDDVAKVLAARGAILARHDARWITDLRPWDDALVHASRKRAGLPEAYASPDEMVDVLERRCRAGGAQSCLRAARIMQFQTRLDGPRAIAIVHKGCELGLDKACLEEPGFYETGRGVPKDPARATRMFQALCDRPIAQACVNLGMYRWLGIGGQPDAKAAYDLCFSPVKDHRWADWCSYAGGLAVDGRRDTPPDFAMAARLYRQACKLGVAHACGSADRLEHKP
jgi:hypothetical protein